jgi:DUF4097 and DUF4098 domain-containing protein YvlB
MKKLLSLNFLWLAAATLICSAPLHAQDDDSSQAMARIPAAQSVSVSLCVASGNIFVRGWNKGEVVASIESGGQVTLHRTDEAREGSPATSVEVLVSDDEEGPKGRVGDCSANGDITLNVPRGARISLRTLEGDIDAEGVGEARLESASGNVNARDIALGAELKSAAGDLAIENSAGKIQLATISGNVVASGLKSRYPNDSLSINSTSGDVRLGHVGYSRLEVRSISGQITVKGPLAQGAKYDLNTTNGDITLAIPSDSSFQLIAKVFKGGDIITDFPLKYTSETPPSKAIAGGRIQGTFGSGDAVLNLSSVNGTIRLRKKQ